MADYLGANGRVAEWVTSMVLVGLAITIALPGDSLALNASFAAAQRMGVDETMLAALTGTVGSARMVALYVNGNWRRSPAMRMIGSAFGAVAFSVLAASYGAAYITGETSAPSTASTTYLVLTLADLLATYRSARDARMAWN